MQVRQRIVSIFFWSVIAAAFIGPGTLVTASTAGSKYGLSLLWTLAFAVIACIIFQEMAARLTLMTDQDLASTLSKYRLRWIISIIPLSVILGCMAYEAGNIQGATIGFNLLFPEAESYTFILVGIISGLLLWFSAFKRLIIILGQMVAFMGFAFLFLAMRIAPPADEIFNAILSPGIPDGADWLILGLIGTTVVPYNLFLGSGISRDTTVGLMRFGLITSVILGGLISMAILVTGTLMQGREGLSDLITVAQDELGYVSGIFVSFGLFAAGFTSAITAPLAAGLVARGFFQTSDKVARIVSLVVVLSGMLSGLLHFKPEIIILTAQAMNGLVLPLVAGYLWLLSNSPSLMKDRCTPLIINILAYLIMIVLIVIGLRNILTGWYGLTDAEFKISINTLIFIAVPIATILAGMIWRIKAAER